MLQAFSRCYIHPLTGPSLAPLLQAARVSIRMSPKARRGQAVRLRGGSQEVAERDGRGLCSLTTSWVTGDKLSPSGVKERSVSHRVKGSSAVWTSGSQNKLISRHLEGF